jgi:hypothetical protein
MEHLPSRSIINLKWHLPDAEGIYEVTCEVTNIDQLTTTQIKSILVKPIYSGTTPAFAYFPMDGDVNDYSGHNRNAIMSGVDETADARGEQN